MNAAIPERKPATEEISGLIERVTFHNDESGLLPAANENTGASRGSYGDWGAALSDCWSVRRSVCRTRTKTVALAASLKTIIRHLT